MISTLQVNLTKTTKVQNPDGSISWHREEIPYVVNVEIDVTGLAQVLGKKALGNKSRKAREVGGLIEVTIT